MNLFWLNHCFQQGYLDWIFQFLNNMLGTGFILGHFLLLKDLALNFKLKLKAKNFLFSLEHSLLGVTFSYSLYFEP